MEGIKSAWKSPSNIAIVKYWGKKGFQLPANPSISFTLDNVFTETEVWLKEKEDTSTSLSMTDSGKKSDTEALEVSAKERELEVDFYFEDKPKPEFLPKILKFLNVAAETFAWLKTHKLEIRSHNNFPHGTGIASSASSMSALALCVVDLDQKLNNSNLPENEFLRQASYWSRIGSGSACRSVYGGFTAWGKHPDIAGSSDKFAVPLPNIHAVFNHIKDTVLLIDEEEKSVSSSKGHAMLNKHWYAARRYEQGVHNTQLLYKALQEGDVKTFGQLAEQEALTLHAMMLTSDTGYFLIKPNTLIVLDKIRAFREQSGLPVFFTLDAGANVHLLHFENNEQEVKTFIDTELLPHCSETGYISSGLGAGAKRI